MKFCVFSVSMPEYDIAESAKLLKELGYEGVEWRVADVPKDVPAEVPFERRYWANNRSTLDVKDIENEAKKAKTICDEVGIDIIALTSYLPVTDIESITRVCKAAQSIDCHQVRIGLVGFDPDKTEETYPEAFSKMREALKAVEKVAAETQVKCVLEIHMDTLISSASAAYRALEGFDPRYLGLIYDPGNMVKEGYEVYKKSFQLLGDYIAHIHVKNGSYVQNGVDELGAAKWDFVWKPLKEGTADLKKLFQVCREMGYDGTFSIEDFSNEQSTEDKLRDNLAYLNVLKEAASK